MEQQAQLRDGMFDDLWLLKLLPLLFNRIFVSCVYLEMFGGGVSSSFPPFIQVTNVLSTK